MSTGKRYKHFERALTKVLLLDTFLFVLFLVFSGMSIVWLKVICVALTILLSVGGLVLLYMSRELLRQRSLWLSCGFFSIFVCTLASLILAFP